ncbi:helix-turn-helix domain-containing protein [Sphingobium boeckii]|uniref:Helix-turn-helix domain-containing protein n=1 Tax=Sphingobium boeckii TaxID=1082345 RepID=A0A7W9AGG6_9SPHN|nr:helix-turn-helix domain-containing protein [Sphingobium boeckii]MBB5685021.1 hypothetical protein [Sphingobium boeckii]
MQEDETRADRARRSCPYLDSKQAAYHLGLSHRTLAKMRLNGRGPRVRRHGHVCRYHIDDLDAWSRDSDGA